FGAHMFSGGMMVGGPHLFFGRNFPNCASVTVEGDDFPKKIIIDYGEGCVGIAGLEKRGTITIEMTDTITNAGATYTITFEDVTIGNRQVEKSATISNEGMDADGNWIISMHTVTSSTVSNEGETLIVTRDFSEVKTWLTGFDTPESKDDIFLKSGGGSITVDEELRFERQITDPLLIDRTCMFPLSGIIEITRGGEFMIIDFGAGECDNIAVVTKDGQDEEIELVSGRFRKGFKREHKHMKQNKGWW
ncbi:MAG: hypothetical protein KAT15_30105, partial [Bacteroidales bacterium]|nr:hypothetical protein [Bacteroidales bacterium]